MEANQTHNEQSNSGEPTTSAGEKLISIVLRIGGGIGVVLHLVAIVVLFIVRPRFVETIQTFTKEVSGQVLELDLVLQNSEESLRVASTTLSDTSDFLSDSQDLVDESSDLLIAVGELVGEDATETILSTQDALEAAIPGAQTIDSMMKALAVLEPLTGFSYDPEKTLSQGLEEVSASLKPLPESLQGVQSQLVHAAEELDDLKPGLKVLSEDVSDFSDTLQTVAQRLDRGKQVFQSIQDSLETIHERVAPISWISTIIASVFFAFGAISQLSTFLVGKQN